MSYSARVGIANESKEYWKGVILDMQAGNWDNYAPISMEPEFKSGWTIQSYLNDKNSRIPSDSTMNTGEVSNLSYTKNGGSYTEDGEVFTDPGSAAASDSMMIGSDKGTGENWFGGKNPFAAGNGKTGLAYSSNEVRDQYLRQTDGRIADTMTFDEIMAENHLYQKGMDKWSQTWEEMRAEAGSPFEDAGIKVNLAGLGNMLSDTENKYRDDRAAWMGANSFTDEQKRQIESNYAKVAKEWNDNLPDLTTDAGVEAYRKEQYEKAVARYKVHEHQLSEEEKEHAQESGNFFASNLGKAVIVVASIYGGWAASSLFTAGSAAGSVAAGAASGSISGSLNAAGQGGDFGDIFESGLKGAAIGGLTAGGAHYAAPLIQDGLNAVGDFFGADAAAGQLDGGLLTNTGNPMQASIDAGLPINPTDNFMTSGGAASEGYLQPLVEAGLPITGDTLRPLLNTTVPYTDPGPSSFAENLGDQVGDAIGDFVGSSLFPPAAGVGAVAVVNNNNNEDDNQSTGVSSVASRGGSAPNSGVGSDVSSFSSGWQGGVVRHAGGAPRAHQTTNAGLLPQTR